MPTIFSSSELKRHEKINPLLVAKRVWIPYLIAVQPFAGRNVHLRFRVPVPRHRSLAARIEVRRPSRNINLAWPCARFAGLQSAPKSGMGIKLPFCPDFCSASGRQGFRSGSSVVLPAQYLFGSRFRSQHPERKFKLLFTFLCRRLLSRAKSTSWPGVLLRYVSSPIQHSYCFLGVLISCFISSRTTHFIP